MEQHSLKDIEKVSYDLLKSSNSLDVFPTPVDNIVQYSELFVNYDINITDVHKSYIKHASDVLYKAIAKVRGLLDRKKKVIFLDLTQLPTRKNFVKLHEVGHEVLPWQKNIHDILEDDDDSLSTHTTEEFEIEANYFASVTLFQHDRFISEMSKLNLGIESAIHLSKLFGASIHATLRRFVECSPKRCALLILEKLPTSGLAPKYSKRDFFSSTPFNKTFGELNLPCEFGYKWPFIKDYYFSKKGIRKGSINLSTENGEADFNYHFFNNSFNGFVLIFPIGEKITSKTKIIISESI